VAALRLLADLDRAGLAAYCGAYALWAEAIVQIEKYGAIIKSPQGFPIQAPSLAIANRQAEIMMRIASEFGFKQAGVYGLTSSNAYQKAVEIRWRMSTRFASTSVASRIPVTTLATDGYRKGNWRAAAASGTLNSPHTFSIARTRPSVGPSAGK